MENSFSDFAKLILRIYWDFFLIFFVCFLISFSLFLVSEFVVVQLYVFRLYILDFQK